MTRQRILALDNMYSRRAQIRRFAAEVACMVLGGAVVSWLLIIAIDAASQMLAKG